MWALAACSAPVWDLAALERRHPQLARIEGQRLQDVTPYLLPRHDELELFLCRWEVGEPLRAALPPEATERERGLLERALASWEGMGLGIRFQRGSDAATADIAIRIDEEGSGAGSTASDCAVVEQGEGLAAQLVRADVWLQRVSPDTLGRPVPMSDAEWLGAALHELGHALGFQGHVRHGAGVMAREPEQVRREGRRVLAGEPLRAPSVEALYRVPSGTLLGRLRLARGRTAEIDRLAARAPADGYRGPLVRVGDHAARIAWWNAEGRSLGVELRGLPGALRHPASLEIVPDLLARAWLGRGDAADL